MLNQEGLGEESMSSLFSFRMSVCIHILDLLAAYHPTRGNVTGLELWDVTGSVGTRTP